MLAAGRLRHLVVLQRNTPNRSPYGQATPHWSDVATLHAEVIPLAGRELVNARQIHPTASHRVTVRASIPILPTDRFLFQGRTLNIEAVLRTNEVKVMYDITCTEPVSTVPTL